MWRPLQHAPLPFHVEVVQRVVSEKLMLLCLVLVPLPPAGTLASLGTLQRRFLGEGAVQSPLRRAAKRFVCFSFSSKLQMPPTQHLQIFLAYPLNLPQGTQWTIPCLGGRVCGLPPTHLCQRPPVPLSYPTLNSNNNKMEMRTSTVHAWLSANTRESL